MRYGNLAGRATLFTDDGAVDLEKASGGLFSADPHAVYDRWDELRAWTPPGDAAVPFDRADLGAPSPRPGQVFAIGVNYRDHAEESSIDVTERPVWPPTFTKFASCLTGPDTVVALPSDGLTDWEVELVAVVGRGGRHIAESDAWAHVAGLTVGQDLSERLTQLSGPQPQQFSLGKSYAGFGPTGPWLVSPDAFADPGDLELGCSLNGEVMQAARTGEMLFSVPALIARLSAVTALAPGDVIFTGTPAGIGGTRTPPRFLRPGDELVSHVTGIGTLTTRFEEN